MSYSGWETVIGLEVHVQLATKTKIFSGTSTAFGAEANTQACAIDLAMPGTLPVLNKQAVHYARDHSVEDSLRQMGWLQGAIWSNAHVRGAVASMKTKKPADFPDLAPLQGFRDMA